MVPGRYLTVVARPEPENSLLEIVTGFSQKLRGFKLVVLGRYDPEKNPYHRAVIAAASEEVVFLGAIFVTPVVRALRFHSAAYAHGHQVGGTNPSLIEAMGAGNPIFAKDNQFNRWVAGKAAKYYSNADDFSERLDEALSNPEMLAQMKAGTLQRFHEEFTWDAVLAQYETLLLHWLPKHSAT